MAPALNRDGSDTGAGLVEIAWGSAIAGGETNAVAQKAANGCGLFDMSSNVWEWRELVRRDVLRWG
jgi:formylglycine-generating enzyme required for sulfatase activity